MPQAPLHISIPYSPNQVHPLQKTSSLPTHSPTDAHAPKPHHLGLPPVFHDQPLLWDRHAQFYPSGPSSLCGESGSGFEATHKSPKNRSIMLGAKKPVELRKEIATKLQRAKQLERRVLFLSKLVAPPSPTAIDLPVTPPDSPAVFHFTLPSPGLESPLELFENVTNHPELYQSMSRIEQVDFRLPDRKRMDVTYHGHDVGCTNHRPTIPPSLDQISQRLSKDSPSIGTSPREPSIGISRLPSFLRSRTTSLPTPHVTPTVPSLPKALTPDTFCSTLPNSASLAVPAPNPVDSYILPPSPTHSSPRLTLQITTTICPPTRTKSSPTQFTEENISQFGSQQSGKHAAVKNDIDNSLVARRRAQVTKDMFHKLSRRNPIPLGVAAYRIKAQDDASPLLFSPGAEDKVKRRTSAPPDLSAAQSRDSHPVLRKPGGF